MLHIASDINSAFRKISIEKLILLTAGILSIGFLLRLFLVYDDSFVHPDYYRYILQETLRDGLPIQWLDVVNSLQLRSPGEFRPRFLAYLIQAVDQKLRLFSYDHVLIPPTFSPISWMLELLVGPYFLFKAVVNLTSSRRAAVAATVVYLSTTGFLSGVTMVLLQGKNLSNVILILCIYLASDIAKKSTGERHLYRAPGIQKYLLLGVLFLGLFLDEMPIFAFAAIPALFPKLFFPRGLRNPEWRELLLNGLFFCLPAFLFVVVVLFVVPEITQKYFGFRFDYLGNTLLIGENTRGAKSLFEGPYAKFSWNLVYQNAMTLFGFAAVPSQISPFVKSDYGAYPGTQVANAAKWIFVIGTLAIAAALATYGRPPARDYLRTIPVVFVGFFVFLTLLLIRHIPIATGYYYGAIYAGLLAVFVGLCYGALDTESTVLRAMAAVTILFLVIVGASNFSQVNRGWIITHNESIVRGSFQSIVQLSEPQKLRRGELLDIWHAWKDGNLTGYLDVTPISTGAVYLVGELQALDKARGGSAPPRHVLVAKTGY
jgi:hypothetical protein